MSELVISPDSDSIQALAARCHELEREVEQLKRRVQLYETVVSNTDDFLYVFDLQHRFIYANRALLTVWGKDWSQAIGKTCLELGYEPSHAAMHSREIEQVISTRAPIKGEVPFAGTTGCRIYEYSFVPVFDQDGNVQAIAGSTRDVTERSHAERYVRESEVRLRKIFEHAATGIAITDIQGRFVDCNPAYCRTTGYDSQSLSQCSLSMLLHMDDRDENLRLMRELIVGNLPSFEIENRYIKRDGSVVWVHKFSSLLRDDTRGTTHIIELVTDINERKKVESALRTSEEFNRSVMDASADCIKIINLDGTLHTVNATGLALMELESGANLCGKHWTQFWPDSSKPDVCSALERALRGQTCRFTGFRPTAKGTPKWWDVQVSPVRDPQGKILRLLSVSRDITERKNFEEQLQSTQFLAESANRAKSDFLANMSHEIRTPMTAILGYSDLIASRLQDPDDLQCIETIRSNGRFLVEIINDILDLSKIEADKMELAIEKVSPEVIISDVISLLEMRAREKKIALSAEIACDLPESIQTDPVRLRQILLNLLGNAIKFTEVGSVRLVPHFDAGRSMLLFDIIDTGIGVHPELLPRLFQPFTQADASVTRTHGGTGLGLAISKRLALLLGGDLLVESQPDNGSKFTVEIATGDLSDVRLVRSSLKNRDSAAATVDAPLPCISCTALVVDDRREVRYLAQHFIEEAGGKVLIAQNGAEALELLGGAAGSAVDLVVMDISMPVMDGYTAARSLREKGFTRPILALTANAMQGDREKCLEAGFNDYTTKPLVRRILVEAIKRLIEV